MAAWRSGLREPPGSPMSQTPCAGRGLGAETAGKLRRPPTWAARRRSPERWGNGEPRPAPSPGPSGHRAAASPVPSAPLSEPRHRHELPCTQLSALLGQRGESSGPRCPVLASPLSAVTPLHSGAIRPTLVKPPAAQNPLPVATISPPPGSRHMK